MWLNEGFASYMEYLGADAVCPELKTLDQFVVQELQNVFHLDSLKSSHQISVAVNNSDEINYIFDRISYGKGATIIRMMEHFLTSKVFRKGLTNYLQERKYSSAEQDDLWSALTEQAYEDGIFDGNMTIKEIMDTWTLQTGYPVVTAIRNETSLILKQERFLIGGKSEDKNSTLWWLPITLKGQYDNMLTKIWMKAEQEIVIDFNRDPSFWFLVNVNQTGYYRVNYDIENWQLLTKELNSRSGFKNFDPKNRAQLLDDALNLASAGYLDYDMAMNVTRYLVHEREYVPWRAAFNSFDFLYAIFSHSGQFDKFKDYMLYLLDGLYKEITFNETPNDATLKIYMRMDMLWRACQLGKLECVQESLKQFNKWQFTINPDKENVISPNLRGIVYCNAIKSGSQSEWDFAWQRYLNTDVGSEKELLMSGLGCSREPWILYRYLEWAITEGSGIRKQDSVRVFSAVSSTIVGQHISYSFLKANWNKIKKYMGSSLMLFTGIVRECISTYPSQEELTDIKQFVKSKSDDLSSASRVIQQLVEQGEANLEWKKRNFDKIVRWLSSFRG
ncbi:Peptidase [Oryctes borbonicus]|uniref:Aminopeptidase N n=1 Tax=Oryctes borbonicus TaxID=1629725 RepID=A0A0T6B4V9_9SCAR|nr:Peptidase [Oryctes borbonicus]